jgi:hypothetical protein
MSRYFFCLAALMVACLNLQAQGIQSPSDFLPHQHGQQFTPHHLLVDYVEYVADNSDKVQLIQYGRTNEGRPLMAAFISSEENLARLDEIRLNNLRKTGLADGQTDAALDRAIVWLSFGVHGNEAGASESSMSVLYELVRDDNAQVKGWLENTIVVFDPSINPDGYSRYTHWYRGVANQHPSPENNTREHREPWPGGRVNHYLFDLNRDWAWQTQVETRQRLEVYLDWMPHIHVDYHEQYPNNPYYFAPAAAPFHEYINRWQRDFQHEIGENHAGYFDKKGWLYFTREYFDLLYPSYGDTYPIFHGAIGMTYEQAGHGLAGRAYQTENGDTLTLDDRIAHHTTTALSTVEMASENADRLVEEFEAYFKAANDAPTGDYKTYVIKANNPQKRIQSLLELLDINHIQYSIAQSPAKVNAFHYLDNKKGSYQINEGDLLISAYQPLSVMVQVLFDPEPVLEDSLTYDITAWSIPYAYGLDAFATTQRINSKKKLAVPAYKAIQLDEAPYALAAEWNSPSDAKFLGSLLKANIKVRFAQSPLTIAGQEYPPGTLLATRADNRKNPDWYKVCTKLAEQQQQTLYVLQTGFSDSGTDLGSDKVTFLQRPKVALLSGEGTSPNSFGELWHFFEQTLDYPVDIYYISQINQVTSADYNTLVLPEGGYRWNDQQWSELKSWIRAGGKVILLGSALNNFADRDGFSLKRKESQPKEEEPELEDYLHAHNYAGQARRSISGSIPGAIFEAKLDETHPLAFGLGTSYYTLKTSSRAFQMLEGGWNVGHLSQNPEPIGFAGYQALEAQEGALAIGQESFGRGTVIYLVDNPMFRGFWKNGHLLFSNALFITN